MLKNIILIMIALSFVPQVSVKAQPNIYAIPGDTIVTSSQCPSFVLSTVLGYSNPNPGYVSVTTKYYFSTDAIFDTSDVLMLTRSIAIFQTVSNWSSTLALPGGLNTGYYYVFYEHDATNVVVENNESDNRNFAVIKVDTVINAPIVDDFEVANPLWKTYSNGANPMVWELGLGYRHHLEGAHSGTKAWHTGKTIDYNNVGPQYVELPFIDLTTIAGNKVLSFWYKKNTTFNNHYVEYSTNCARSWQNLAKIPAERNDDWDFINIPLNLVASHSAIKFRIRFTGTYVNPEGLIFDDLYVGVAMPDLTVEGDKGNRFTNSAVTNDTLEYFLNNSGLASAFSSITSFYWSSDSILDNSDHYLGSVNEPAISDTTRIWRSFPFIKPSSTHGKYYIHYVLDTANSVAEMREYNNIGYFECFQQGITPTPYFNDFEVQPIDWRHNSSLGQDDWEWASPSGNTLNGDFVGTKAWITNSNGLVSPMSRMHLYSPVFDLTSMTNPVMEFDMINTGCNAGCPNGKSNMSYSTDRGKTWTILDTTSKSYNRWYYLMVYDDTRGTDGVSRFGNLTTILFEESEPSFAVDQSYNGRNSDRGYRFTLDISPLTAFSEIQFRYNMATLKNMVEEGVIVDNFSISEAGIDLEVKQQKELMLSPQSPKVKFHMFVRNSGNYISQPTTIKYYLSTDTTLDGQDLFLGRESIPAIRPDLNSYLNVAYNSPANLLNYEYLIYELDSANTNIESNESNNIGFWSLGFEGIKTLPYFEDFNDSITQGWNHSVNGTAISDFRFRNLLSPGDGHIFPFMADGQLFTDVVNNTIFNVPTYFIETPRFNFSDYNKLFLSFDLECTGTPTNSQSGSGGNLSFSLDGGNTWVLLTSQHGLAHNWYYSHALVKLGNEKGWANYPKYGNQSVLDSTSIDISFLKGEPDVLFRFKYHSNSALYGTGTTHGMRIDNFKITGQSLDYEALDSAVPISASIHQSVINLNYSIRNNGPIDGDSSKTKFFWSEDSILDVSDTLAYTISEGEILTGDTLNHSFNLTYPTPVRQSKYYLFYVTDGDRDIAELNELNNLGSYLVSFAPYINYAVANPDSIYVLMANPSFNINYSIENTGDLDGVNTSTAMFWSKDDKLDVLDVPLQTIPENPILAQSQLNSNSNIIYPTPVTQADYYLLYKADATDSIFEADETDNLGLIKIHFDIYSSLIENELVDVEMFVSGDNLFILAPQDMNNEAFSMRMYSTSGQSIFAKKIVVNAGTNTFVIPSNISAGLYLITVSRGSEAQTLKVIISK